MPTRPRCKGCGGSGFRWGMEAAYDGDTKYPCTYCKGTGVDLPTVVCLCGSTRFIDAFNEARKTETLAGKIVLSIEIVTTQSREHDPQFVNPEVKAMLDELHLRKIDLADEVLILNVGGYIGESTSRELAYAKEHGKVIRYLETAK